MANFLFTLNAKEAEYKSNVPERTHANVSYGKDARQALDFWKASSKKPTPLVVVIHGGAWMKGSKEQLIQGLDIKPLLEAGISVASINYRLIKANKDDSNPAVKNPLHDAARAIQFLRTQAKKWNLDKKKFAAVGQSAGGCSSLWLLYHDDMAKPESEDPIERESTRLYCAAVSLAQTSIDPKQTIEWTPNSYYGGHAFGYKYRDVKTFLKNRERLLPLIKKYSPSALVTKDDPQAYLYYLAPPKMGTKQKDPTHSANLGLGHKNICDKLKVKCELAYPGNMKEGIGSDKKFDHGIAQYLIKTLNFQ